MQIDLPNSKACVGKTAPGPTAIDGKAFTRLVREATPTARAFLPSTFRSVIAFFPR